MPTGLPSSSDFSGSTTSKGTFKAWGNSVRDYLAGLFGTDGATATALATLGAPLSGYAAKTSAYSVVAADKGKLFGCTGTWTLSLLAAATAGDGFTISVRNSSTGVITIDPNLSENIDGASSLAINAGESITLYCDGTGWWTVGKTSGVPSGAGLEYHGATLPSGWLWQDGSAVSRTTYASLFAAIGTTHGAGDGSTTFNLPDHRSRVGAGKDNMGGTAANRLTTAGSGVDGATLGAAGGVQNVTLTAAESGLRGHAHTIPTVNGTDPVNAYGNWYGGGNSASSLSTSSIGDSNASQAHTNVQPTLVCNFIIKA